jgi:hypothetical protein
LAVLGMPPSLEKERGSTYVTGSWVLHSTSNVQGDADAAVPQHCRHLRWLRHMHSWNPGRRSVLHVSGVPAAPWCLEWVGEGEAWGWVSEWWVGVGWGVVVCMRSVL